MAYRTVLEKRLAILDIFCDENVPRTLITIGRKLGYKNGETIRVVMRRMFDEGIFYRHTQARHNGTSRYLYLMAESGKKERDLLSKSMFRSLYNGIS